LDWLKYEKTPLIRTLRQPVADLGPKLTLRATADGQTDVTAAL
jgi:hypothetical protein